MLASICFALKDNQTAMGEKFWQDFAAKLERNKDAFDDENKELVAGAVRDNTHLQHLQKYFPSKMPF